MVVDELREALERTPRVLRGLLEGVDERVTRAGYGPGTWSPHEVVAHLIFGERTDWIPRARLVLSGEGERRAFEPFDRAGHAELARDHSTAELLSLFETERAKSLAELAVMRIGEGDLKREGLHPALGRVTLENLLQTWAVHDLNHVAQVCKGLAHQRREKVGPWEAYLSVLAAPNPR